jgi:hypothetical protein
MEDKVDFSGVLFSKQEIMYRFPTSKLATLIRRGKTDCFIRFPFDICPHHTGKKYFEQISYYMHFGKFRCSTENKYDDRFITAEELYEALKFLGINISKDDIIFECHHQESSLYDSDLEDDEVLDNLFK